MAAVLCLAGAAAGVITLAGVAELRGHLTAQVDQQLVAEAAILAHHAEAAWPGQAATPGVPGGTYAEVFAPGGQPLLPQNQRPGPAVPASPAWARAHAGRPVTVPGQGGGQSWRIIAVPVHYRAHHIMYVYGADDVSLILTSRAGPGLPATLVVGTGLAGIGQAAGRLTATGIAVSIVMILAAAGASALAIRASLRPLGGSISTILGRAGETPRAPAAAESAARHATEQMRRTLVDALQELREPLSVVAGFAAYHRQRGGEPGATMRRLEDETARMDVTVDRLSAAAQRAGRDPPQASAEPPQASAEPAEASATLPQASSGAESAGTQLGGPTPAGPGP
jgi:two-component system, OmpR family, sensor kinase